MVYIHINDEKGNYVYYALRKYFLQKKNNLVTAYLGEWEYNLWVNDSSLLNKTFYLALRQYGNDSINGIFNSVMRNGVRIDGGLLEDKENITGIFSNDSIFLEIDGAYDSTVHAKAVIHLECDSILLWKLEKVNGVLFLPYNAVLKRLQTDSKVH